MSDPRVDVEALSATIQAALERLPNLLYRLDSPHPSGRFKVWQGEEAAAALAELKAEAARAQEYENALRRYGHHDQECPASVLTDGYCICGLSRALAQEGTRTDAT